MQAKVDQLVEQGKEIAARKDMSDELKVAFISLITKCVEVVINRGD